MSSKKTVLTELLLQSLRLNDIQSVTDIFHYTSVYIGTSDGQYTTGPWQVTGPAVECEIYITFYMFQTKIARWMTVCSSVRYSFRIICVVVNAVSFTSKGDPKFPQTI